MISSASHQSLPGGTWRKSSYSNGSGGECVEVASAGDGTLVRDSKDPEGPVLAFPVDAWADFVRGLKDGASYGDC